MIRYIGDKMNYTLIISTKALIYASFHESNPHDFGYVSYDIITLEHTTVHIQIYNKTTHYSLDLLDLDSAKDDDLEKGE